MCVFVFVKLILSSFSCSEGRRSFGSPRRRWTDNIQIRGLEL